MAKFYTDFRENYIGNGVPTGWTSRINNGGPTYSLLRNTAIASGKMLRISGTANGSKIASYNAADGANDVETLVKFRVNGTESGRQGIAIHRYSGTLETNTAGYSLVFLPASSVKSLIILNDQTGATHNFTNYNWTMGTVYWARFRTVGNAIQAKVWADGSAEPGSWLLDSTDSAFGGGAGTYNGVGSYTANTSGVDFMEYAVATAGETATRDLPAPATFSNGYMYRKKVTAQSAQLTTSTLTHHVMTIDITDNDLKAVPAGGKIYNEEVGGNLDVLFTTIGGTTIANYNEIYNNGTGRLLSWFKMPSLGNAASATDSRSVYMYYGKPQMASTNESSATVWSGYQLAIVMNGGGSGVEYNRTQNDTWAAQTSDDGVTGKLGLGRSLTSGNIYKNPETKYNLAQNNVLSVWVKLKGLPTAGSLVAWPLYQIAYGTAGQHNGAFRIDRAAGGQVSLNQVKYGIIDQNVNWNPSTNVWYLLTTVQSTTDIKYYVNGALLGSFSNSSQYNWTTTVDNQITMGRPDGGSQARPNVDVDYTYKYSGTRSADQILTDYRNQNDAVGFWSIGATEVPYTTVDQTQGGNARIQRQITNTQPGISRITQQVPVPQIGTARIQNSATQIQSANARLQRSEPKTQAGNARIARQELRTQYAIARIQASATRNQSGAAMISIITTKNQPGIARIAELGTVATQTGISRITAQTPRTQPANARIQKSVTKTTAGNARIQKSVTKNQPATANIRKDTPKNQPGNAAILQGVLRDQTAVARILRIMSSTQPANARIQKSVTQSVIGNARIRIFVLRNQLANSAILRIPQQHQPARGLIAKEMIATQPGGAFIIRVNEYQNPPRIGIRPQIGGRPGTINAGPRNTIDTATSRVGRVAERPRVDIVNTRPRARQ